MTNRHPRSPVPARELTELYRARWEIETALGAMKPQMRGSGIVLRPKSPDGVVQEILALLSAYIDAAHSGTHPSRRYHPQGKDYGIGATVDQEREFHVLCRREVLRHVGRGVHPFRAAGRCRTGRW